MYTDRNNTSITVGDKVSIDSTQSKWKKTNSLYDWIILYFREYELVIEAVVQHKVTKEIAFFPLYAITKQ